MAHATILKVMQITIDISTSTSEHAQQDGSEINYHEVDYKNVRKTLRCS